MYYPTVANEHDTIVGYLEMLLGEIRNSAHGLTTEQAQEKPVRSELSIAGILKHTCYVMAGALAASGQLPEDDPDHALVEDFFGSFDATAEPLEAHLARFDRLRPRYLDACRQWAPDTDAEVPPMPWLGVNEPKPIKARYMLVHHIEELARHAGHADIIREQVDGAKAMELQAAVEGREANEFVTPWQPGGKA